MDKKKHKKLTRYSNNLQKNVRKDEWIVTRQSKKTIMQYKKEIQTIPSDNNLVTKNSHIEAPTVISQSDVNSRTLVHQRLHKLPSYINELISKDHELEEPCLKTSAESLVQRLC